MSKKDKNLLFTGLVLYLVPEIIWGITLGLFSIYPDFVSNADNNYIVRFVLFIQLIGLLASIKVFVALRVKTLAKLALIITSVLTVWVIYILYLLLSTARMWQ